MWKIFLVGFIFKLISDYNIEVLAQDQNANIESYVAGVVEYGNEIQKDEQPQDYIRKNVQAYLHFIDLAKEENVDILVFPEATLNYFSTRQQMLQNAFVIPDPSAKIAPWEKSEYSEHLKALSKKCKEKQIYVLVNLVEKVPCTTPNSCKNPTKTYRDGYDIFNTNVVFDRQGRIISKYQKYNLYNEPLVDTPLTAQHSIFTTDFDVKFAHIICFDILFQEPIMSLVLQENITNFLYPSMWFSDLPFLTSNQIHQAWAYANNVNLLSAGANHPKYGNSGSGIYLGRNAISQIFISPFPTQRLLTATIPKDPKRLTHPQLQSQQKLDKKFTPIEMQNLQISEYWAESVGKTENLTINNEPKTICVNDDDICCTFNIKFNYKEPSSRKIAYNYKLLVNYTTKMYALDRECGEIYCVVLACKTDNPKSCGRRFKMNGNLINAFEFENIEINAKIKYNNPQDLLIVPSTLDTSITPLDINNYNFEMMKDNPQGKESFKEFKMELQSKIKDILVFGIYGRNFALDRMIPIKNMK